MKFLRRLGALFSRKQLDADMAEEMRLHLEQRIEENVATGMSPDEARYAALRKFGGVEQAKEHARDQRAGEWLHAIWRDLRYGFRSLMRQPGFTAVAVLTLGFGIGVNVTIFSFVEDIVGRPAALAREQRIAAVHVARTGTERAYRAFSYPEFETVRRAPVFERAAVQQFSTVRIGPLNRSQLRIAAMVSEDYFRVLGVTPWRGRFFNPDESHAAADVPVVVASYMLWQRLGARSDFVGSQLEIDGRTFTVIGVTPRGFGGLQWCIGPDVWLPLGMASFVSEMRTTARLNVLDPTWRPWNIIAKLAPETSLAAANAGVAPLNETLTAQAGLRAGERLELLIDRPAPANANLTIPEHATVVSTYAAMSGGITIVVLLVACLNVANMLLARGAARQREIAIRLSLGASRGRVVRQLVTEGLLLGLGGAAMGLLLSRVANEALLELTRRATENQPFSFYLQTTVDWPLLVTTLGLGVLATLACSVLPAFRVTRVDLAHDLKQVPADIHGSARFFSGRHMLVMLQIALSVMLLFSAGLLLRGTMNITGDRGFDVAHQLLVKADYSLHRTPREEIPRRQAALADQIAALPGIEHVALASSVPYNFESSWGKIFGVGSAGTGAEPAAEGIFTAVSAGYFDTLGIPLLRGRDFTVEESRQPGKHRVAIIDEVLAKALFGGAEPLGRRIAFASAANRGANSDRELEVIGIVRSPQDDPFAALHPPRVYQPLGQEPHAMIYVHARVARPEAMLATLRKTLGVFDAERPVLFCGPFAEIVDNNLNFWVLRIGPVLFGVFGGAAVFLAAVGVYGVKAYAVTRRTREIGVRVALGATARDVLRLILGQSVRQAAVGIAAGGTLAIVTGLGLSKLLYRVSPTDPLMLGVAATVAALAAIAAAALPAWRATRIQPTEALRTE